MAKLKLGPQKGAQERALNSKADIVIYGGAAGSGKSHMMLLRPLLQKNDPRFTCVFFRRTGPQLTGQGGLWDEAKNMYMGFKPRIVEQSRIIEFKSGAKVQFSHMEHEKNRLDHQGLQYSLIIFDEATHFTKEQVTYLMSRLRSSAEGKSQMFLSCNPDPDSFLLDWIEWWLDEEGYPDPKKSGVIKYFCTVNNEYKYADTEEELKEKWGDYLYVLDKNTGKKVYTPPKTMTFIGGNIFDNPALIANNPAYLAELNSLPDVEKARLLYGNWYARPEGSNYFDRKWLKKTDKVPLGAVCCRAWDKASTEPSEVNTHPDFTASTKMYKDKEGFFYIVGSHHTSNFDKAYPDVFGRFRERPGARDTLILNQSKQDGSECTVIFSQDPGSAGATEYLEASKNLISEGFRVQKDPMPTQTGKLTRFTPFSSACENGLVYIVESTFNKSTLEAFYKELESFDGERSTRTRKDDWADSTASAFNWLCKKAVIPSFTLSEFTRDNPFNF